MHNTRRASDLVVQHLNNQQKNVQITRTHRRQLQEAAPPGLYYHSELLTPGQIGPSSASNAMWVAAPDQLNGARPRQFGHP